MLCSRLVLHCAAHTWYVGSSGQSHSAAIVNKGLLMIFYGKLLVLTFQQGYHLLLNKYLVNRH